MTTRQRVLIGVASAAFIGLFSLETYMTGVLLRTPAPSISADKPTTTTTSAPAVVPFDTPLVATSPVTITQEGPAGATVQVDTGLNNRSVVTDVLMPAAGVYTQVVQVPKLRGQSVQITLVTADGKSWLSANWNSSKTNYRCSIVGPDGTVLASQNDSTSCYFGA